MAIFEIILNQNHDISYMYQTLIWIDNLLQMLFVFLLQIRLCQINVCSIEIEKKYTQFMKLSLFKIKFDLYMILY